MSVELSQDLYGFFRAEVSRAMRALDVCAAQPTEAYLVNLLATVGERADELHTPLVEQLIQAMEMAGAARAACMRTLGDAALVVSGFFGDSLQGRGVTQSYVTTIGSRAYSSAAQGRHGDTVLGDLAHRFVAFARVIDEVREQTTMCTDADVLRLYERWLASGSTAVHERLMKLGLAPSRYRSIV